MSKLAWIVVAALALVACTGRQVLNTLTPERGLAYAPELPYEESGALKLDVYAPPNLKDAPVVVFFYGERWSGGDKSQFHFVGQSLASRGFVAVIPNLREYPQVRFPAFVEDAAKAVRWTREHVGAYGGSPNKLFVMGHNSGAHIAALLALDEEYLKAVGSSRSSLKGMIGLAGPYDFLPITSPDLRDLFGPPDRFALSQPVYWVDGQNPPMMLMHGENDDIIDIRNTNNLAAAISRAGGPVETVIYPRMSQAMIISSLGPMLRSTSDVLDHVTTFVNSHAGEIAAGHETEIQATPLPPGDELPPPP